jgi:hypothetical protein
MEVTQTHFLYASSTPLILFDPLGLRVTPMPPPAPPIPPPQTIPPAVCPRPEAAPLPSAASSPGVGAVIGAFLIGLFNASPLGNQTLEEAHPEWFRPCECATSREINCLKIREVDERTCRLFAKRKDWRNYHACMSAAMERYANCLRGKPIRPLFPTPFEN